MNKSFTSADNLVMRFAIDSQNNGAFCADSACTARDMVALSETYDAKRAWADKAIWWQNESARAYADARQLYASATAGDEP